MNPCGQPPLRECSYLQCPDGSPGVIARCDGASWQVIRRDCRAIDGGPPGCFNEQQAVNEFVKATKACMTTAECQIRRATCGQGAEFCDGSYYMNRNAPPDKWKVLVDALDNCMMRSGGCATCDGIPPPAFCVNGVCGPSPIF
jgi:hypothetical protein